jgi:4-carboxymuconolactone decarboxylase
MAGKGRKRSKTGGGSRKRSTGKSPRKSTKPPSPRLSPPPEDLLTPEQRALVAAIRSGPRGKGTGMSGPFAVFLHAPGYGQLAQKLGGYCRLETSVPARLSELAILISAKFWRAQYEWHVHVPHAERAGVKPQTIRDIRAGRAPTAAPKDERAVYDFIRELYRDKRVSDRTYARVHALLGDAGMVEFTGILGYYALVSIALNVFRMPLPDGVPLPLTEPRQS